MIQREIPKIDGVRIRRVISAQFVCQRCKSFCWEEKQVVTTRFLRAWIARFGTPFVPTSRLSCPSGCSDHRGWGFMDLGDLAKESEAKGWDEVYRQRGGATYRRR